MEATFTYGTYGELLGGSTGLTRFLYNGRCGVTTDENGLYYMRQRYYSPELKRFVNQDVLTGSMDNSQSLNRYSYVQGNPVSYTDPFGLSPLAGLFTGTTLIHLGLGILGCVPGIGIAANLADAAVYAYIDHDYFAASMAALDCVTMGAAGMCSLLKTGSMLGKLSKCVSIAGDIVSNTMNFATMSVNWFEHKWDSLDDKQKVTAIVCAVAGVILVAGGIALGSYINHKKLKNIGWYRN